MHTSSILVQNVERKNEKKDVQTINLLTLTIDLLTTSVCVETPPKSEVRQKTRYITKSFIFSLQQHNPRKRKKMSCLCS